MDSRERAILKTLLYADLFDYPLREEEIYKFLIADKKTEKGEFREVLKKIKIPIGLSKGFFFLSERRELIKEREKKEKISLEKLKKAKKIIKRLSLIPTASLIGISGALSMKNSDKDDDIDIFVISKKGFAWTTRFLLVTLLSIFGVYRNRGSKNYSDKICLNMILDESCMSFGKNSQDIYTAHEIVQLLPIFDREKTYERFVKENFWVKNFIPNFLINKNYSRKRSSIFNKLLILLLRALFLEKTSKFLQLNYMKGHITKEVVEDGFLKFHPFDYKTYVLKAYNKRLSQYGL